MCVITKKQFPNCYHANIDINYRKNAIIAKICRKVATGL